MLCIYMCSPSMGFTSLWRSARHHYVRNPWIVLIPSTTPDAHRATSHGDQHGQTSNALHKTRKMYIRDQHPPAGRGPSLKWESGATYSKPPKYLYESGAH